MVYEFNGSASKNIKNKNSEYYDGEPSSHIPSTPPPKKPFDFSQKYEATPSKAYLLQLIGSPGSGTRRLAFQFIQPARSVIWISPKWNLYAPLLWKLAADRGIKLLGLECPERSRWRMLWRELLEAQVFDGWILDNLQLAPGEAAFLQKLTRRFSIRVLSLEERPQAMFPNRAHIYLSHHSYRVQWMKGASPTPQYFESPFLEIFGHP